MQRFYSEIENFIVTVFEFMNKSRVRLFLMHLYLLVAIVKSIKGFRS